jgi:hypothetical protein
MHLLFLGANRCSSVAKLFEILLRALRGGNEFSVSRRVKLRGDAGEKFHAGVKRVGGAFVGAVHPHDASGDHLAVLIRRTISYCDEMPTISVFFGLTIRMYYDDHPSAAFPCLLCRTFGCC